MNNERIAHAFVSADGKSTVTIEADPDAKGTWIIPVDRDGFRAIWLPDGGNSALGQLVGGNPQGQQ
jgi:hypothetical protein